MALFSFPALDELTEALCDKFQKYMAGLNLKKETITLAFSGGVTPAAFFDRLADFQNIPEKRTDWTNVHVFWVDERCVEPGHPESNYTMTRNHLLNALGLDKSRIHRIRGENEPHLEAIRYADEIKRIFNRNSGMPEFSWIFLGVGEDGHTASIFPDRPDLLHSDSICEATRHPVTGQFRVTLTGPVIMHARRITFLVTGHSKSTVIRHIMTKDQEGLRYPAFYINSRANCDWYVDAEAAKQLNLQEYD